MPKRPKSNFFTFVHLSAFIREACLPPQQRRMIKINKTIYHDDDDDVMRV